MNYIPITVFTEDTEISAILRCFEHTISIIVSLSHEELFCAELEGLRVQTFQAQKIFSIGASERSFIFYTNFYQNVCAYLFGLEVRAPEYMGVVAGIRSTATVTDTAFMIMRGTSAVEFVHGRFSFSFELSRLSVNGLLFECDDPENA